jgi:hypothetical protein
MADFYAFLKYVLAAIWFGSGLLAKVLDLVPRHTQIVGQILHQGYAREMTIAIGCMEILMAFWILSGIKQVYCALSQFLVVLTMTILEVVLVPDLLLFGQFNLIPGLLFCSLVVLYSYGKNWFCQNPSEA